MMGRAICTMLLAGMFAGCASMKREPPPPDALRMADVPGFPDCRVWGDDAPEDAAERRALAIRQYTSRPDFDPETPIIVLAISGGAQEAAFGAGLLAGWTEAGDRPEFTVVTGISAGSLLAPFAFLGPDYDDVCEVLFSRYDTKDIFDARYFSALFRGASLSSDKKLRAVLKRHFTPVEMRKIAEEHAKGRRLLVGSTHLDTIRPVIWDLGAIAASGNPRAYELMVDAILASAAFPGVFPPVLFDVEQDGVRYQEMHVDGGLTSQVFAYALNSDIRETLELVGAVNPARVYVLRNAVIWPRVEHVNATTMPILKQTAFAMVNTMALMDLHYIHLHSRDHDAEFRLAYIPSDFREPEEMYDPPYMKELYAMAREKARASYPWEPEPPEFQNEKAGE